MYILNEKDYIRSVLASKKKSDDLSINYLITLTAKYYYEDWKENNEKSVDDLITKVKEIILDFNINGYQEYLYINRIKTICNNLYDTSEENNFNKTFRELEYIPIYKKEINVISTLPTDRQKKFVFTLYVIARYMDCGGWINKKDLKGLSEVFKLANVTLTQEKKNEMLYELHSKGYIEFCKKIDNLNIRVSLSDPQEDEIAYKLTDFTNIGNQYIGNFKKGYKQCKNCGKRIKNTGNRKIYCTECAEKINRIGTKNRMKELRNS